MSKCDITNVHQLPQYEKKKKKEKENKKKKMEEKGIGNDELRRKEKKKRRKGDQGKERLKIRAGRGNWSLWKVERFRCLYIHTYMQLNIFNQVGFSLFFDKNNQIEPIN